jgi:hypothetical protein
MKGQFGHVYIARLSGTTTQNAMAGAYQGGKGIQQLALGAEDAPLISPRHLLRSPHRRRFLRL